MKKLKSLLISLICVVGLVGCGAKTFTIKNSELHSEPYESSASSSLNQNLVVSDQRSSNQSPFSHGRLKINLHMDGRTVDEIKFLSENVMGALSEHGIEVGGDREDASVLNVEQFYIRNHRTNGYTPFITFTTFKGNLTHQGTQYPLAAFVKRGKVPVWSFNEVLDPTLNEPLALVAKEVAAKINQVMFGRKISNHQVAQLVDDIEKDAKGKKTFLKVYELGFGNNQAAIESLVKMTQYDEEYIRLAALSSLGMLKAETQVDYLWSVFKEAKIWQDRAMALKALGDINTEESMDKLAEAKALVVKDNGKRRDWFLEVIALYL